MYKDGKKDGQGTLTFADGSIYTGNFLLNEISGHGRYVWPDGKVYEGDWLKNKMHGKGLL